MTNVNPLDKTNVEVYLPVGGTLELVGILGGDSLGGEQLAERRVGLDLSRHEGVELSWRSRVFRELVERRGELVVLTRWWRFKRRERSLV